jgi:hypothetical protein
MLPQPQRCRALLWILAVSCFQTMPEVSTVVSARLRVDNPKEVHLKFRAIQGVSRNRLHLQFSHVQVMYSSRVLFLARAFPAKSYRIVLWPSESGGQGLRLACAGGYSPDHQESLPRHHPHSIPYDGADLSQKHLCKQMLVYDAPSAGLIL